MKRNTIIIAAAALLLGMTACQKEEPIIVNGDNTPVVGNNEGGFTSLVKSVADLQNTQWAAAFNLGDSTTWAELLNAGLDSAAVADILTLQVDLTFDPDSAYFTFPQDVTIIKAYEVNGMYTIEEMNGLNLAYSYTAASHSGDFTAPCLSVPVPFTYNDTTDVITINLIDDENNVTPLYFSRATATTNND